MPKTPAMMVGLRPGDCAGKDITTMRIVPTIWLVVDGSGSMTDPLNGAMGNLSRWTAIHDSLMDPMTGVVKALEHDVKWGFVVYDGTLPGGGRRGNNTAGEATTCPRIISVEPKKDNYNDISMVFGTDPLGGSTPTDKALQAVISHLPMGGQPVLDGTVSPTIVVLATDGEPNDYCNNDRMRDVKPDVIAAVKQLLAVNLKTYVISLAGDDTALNQHLVDVAAAGGTGKAPFIPMNKDQLIQTFRDIIGTGAACEFTLTGKVKMGLECMGKIEINGTALPCNNDNGWRLKDESTVTITGTACEMYKMNSAAVLHAEFPCEAQILN
jgi:hypothetical protein